MQKKRFITLLFTGLLLINLGHNIVPHHHHFDKHHPCQDCHHHDDGTDVFHSQNSSSHCHAFNGMDYYPVTDNTGIFKLLKSLAGHPLSHTIHEAQDIPFQKILRESRGSPPILIKPAASAAGLRGPPYHSWSFFSRIIFHRINSTEKFNPVKVCQ